MNFVGETWTYLLRYGGRDIELPEGDIILGRSRRSGVRIEDDSVSRNHALLSIRAGKVTVRDLGSSNGLFVNGKRSGRESLVQNGDVIGMGTATVSLRIVPPDGEEYRTEMLSPDSLASEEEPTCLSGAETVPREAAEVTLKKVEIPPAWLEMFLPAPPLVRFLAGATDLVISLLIAGACFLPALVAILTHENLQEKESFFDPVFWILILFCGTVALAAVVVYFLSGWCGRRRSTPGQRLWGLRVVTQPDIPFGSAAALRRLAACALCAATAGIVFLLPELFGRESITDRWSSSRVIASGRR